MRFILYVEYKKQSKTKQKNKLIDAENRRVGGCQRQEMGDGGEKMKKRKTLFSLFYVQLGSYIWT